MAMNDKDNGFVDRAGSSGALVPLYLGGLVLVFVGERVVGAGTAGTVVTGLGVATAVAVTALRFLVAQKAEGDRKVAERTLAIFALLGLVALGLYFTTTDTLKNALGIARATPATRARIEEALNIAWIALLVASVLPLALGELALAPMRRAERIEARRVRSAIRGGVVVSIAAVYVSLFTYASSELEIKADFSFFRTARPSESTRKIAASTTDAIKVTAFFPELNEVGAEVLGYLRDLGAPNVTVEAVDRLMVPTLAKELKVQQDGVVVLTRGASRESLTIGTEKGTSQQKLKTLDGDFQKALLKVLREARVAYLTVGHGELNEPGGAEGRSAKIARKFLEAQNYVVKDLGLAQGLGSEVPADATMVMVLGPQKPLLPEEIGALERYGKRGGHLFLALDPDAKIDLDPVAAPFGIAWSKDLVVAEKNHIRHHFNDSDRALILTNRFSSHASISTLSRASARAAVVLVRSGSLDKRGDADVKVDFTLKSMPDTWLDKNENFQLDAGEKKASYNLAAAVSKPVGGAPDKKGKDAPEMRALIVADADAVSDAVIANEPNLVFFADITRWLGGEESFSGQIASTEDVRIQHTKQKDQVWFFTTIFGAPALLLGVGIWIARRRGRAPSDEPKGEAKASEPKESKGSAGKAKASDDEASEPGIDAPVEEAEKAEKKPKKRKKQRVEEPKESAASEGAGGEEEER